MIFWVLFAAYVAGFFPATIVALYWRMKSKICIDDDKEIWCEHSGCGHQKKPRGEVRTRTDTDVGIAFGWSLLWPSFCVIGVAIGTAILFYKCVTTSAAKLTPLTSGERRRMDRGREKEARKLAREFGLPLEEERPEKDEDGLLPSDRCRIIESGDSIIYHY